MKGRGKLKVMMITISVVLLIGMLTASLACEEAAAPTPTPTATPVAMGDLIALHDDLTDVATDQCIGCHGNKAEEGSLDPDIETAHAIHVPMLVECNFCHKSADLLEGSAASLRKQVDPQICFGCHGPQGPGPQLYQGSAEAEYWEVAPLRENTLPFHVGST